MRAPNGDDLGIGLMIVGGLAPFVIPIVFLVWLLRRVTR